MGAGVSLTCHIITVTNSLFSPPDVDVKALATAFTHFIGKAYALCITIQLCMCQSAAAVAVAVAAKHST